jgi:hypothetical protein
MKTRHLFPLLFAFALTGAACLVAPSDDGQTQDALQCGTGTRPLNGACHKACSTNADCTDPDKCMLVGNDVSLCLDYAGCAYFGSDTKCDSVGSSGYGDLYGEAYDAFGCVGNAVWQVAPASGSPQCGAEHPVRRCQLVNGGCVLVDGTAVDRADR